MTHLDRPTAPLFHDSYPSPSPTQSSSLAFPPTAQTQRLHATQALFDLPKPQPAHTGFISTSAPRLVEPPNARSERTSSCAYSEYLSSLFPPSVYPDHRGAGGVP
ncbi:hypothetical protein BT69DRAFT_1279512 [Atractiella rhizophila]|nr:hypothetical protein BT69DRAFT_1279512 [Atractiella rhizophila]